VNDNGLKIGICGHMRSGKDTVADYLQEKYKFQRFAFGTGIKETINQLFPDQLQNGKPRTLMQQLGQGMRQIDPDVWVKYFDRQVQANTTMDTNVSCTDLRQPNEYKYLVEQGYTIIRVTAPLERRLEHIKAAGDNFTMQNLLHETEKHIELYEVDFEIANDGTLEDLYQKIDNLISSITGGEMV
jgi:dephospho-CoA kinase